MATSITFYSYKGGVGRTLALANVASQLAQLGRRVVVVDLDLEAPGVHYKLRPTVPVSGGVVDLIHEFFQTRKVGDIAAHLREVEYPLHDTAGLVNGWIKILPAGQVNNPMYWQRFAEINWRDFFFGDASSSAIEATGLGLPFFAELKQQLAESTHADVILFDALTGITELGGVATALLADILVCMFVLNDESLDGARRVIHAVRQARKSSESAPVKIFPVLARLPTPEEYPDRKHMNDVQLRRAEDNIVHAATRRLMIDGEVEPMMILHSDPSLQLIERLHFTAGHSTDGDLSSEIQNSLSSVSEGGALLRVQQHRLYFDYVRLFSQLMPPQVIDEYLDAMVKSRREILFEDPDAAVTSLRDLARRFPLPRVYRALLQVYRVQQRYDEDVLVLTRDFVKVTGDIKEELVWDLVRNAIPYLESEVNVEPPDFDGSVLEFAFDVWSARLPLETKLGLSLAALFSEAEREDFAAKVLEMTARQLLVQGNDPDTSIQVVMRLIRLKIGELALELLKRLPIGDDPGVLRLWMRAVLVSRDSARAEELLEQPDFHDRAQRASLGEWFAVMRLAGKGDEALSRIEVTLSHLLEALRRGEEVTQRVAQRLRALRGIYEHAGRLEELRSRVSEALTKSPSQLRRAARILEEPHPFDIDDDDDDLIEGRWRPGGAWGRK